MPHLAHAPLRFRLIPALTAALAVSAALLLATACGGDSGGGACADFGNTLCDKACACTDGDGCIIEQGGVTISFDQESDCRGFYVTLGCSEPDPDVDYDTCTAALDGATCVTVQGGEHDGEMALEQPACQ